MPFPLTVIRRTNALLLFNEYVQGETLRGAEPVGLAAKFAAKLEISASMWSQIKGARGIGDNLARQIEQHCGKPALWLDVAQGAEQPDAGEERFLALARDAYRSQNARGKRALRTLVIENTLRRSGTDV